MSNTYWYQVGVHSQVRERVLPHERLLRQEGAMDSVGEVIAHPQQVTVGRRQVIPSTRERDAANRCEAGDNRSSACNRVRSASTQPPSVMARSCFRNPEMTIMATCTNANRIISDEGAEVDRAR